jgi:hypothetical protein
MFGTSSGIPHRRLELSSSREVIVAGDTVTGDAEEQIRGQILGQMMGKIRGLVGVDLVMCPAQALQVRVSRLKVCRFPAQGTHPLIYTRFLDFLVVAAITSMPQSFILYQMPTSTLILPLTAADFSNLFQFDHVNYSNFSDS